MTGLHRQSVTRRPRHALLVPPIANLKSAIPLALDDDLAVERAQFDLANVTTSSIDLLRNQSRAHLAVACSERRNVSASVDADCCRRRIEIRLQHKRPAGTSFLAARFSPHVGLRCYTGGFAVFGPSCSGDRLCGRNRTPKSHPDSIAGRYRRFSVRRSHSRLKAAFRLRASRARTRFSKSRSRQYRAAASPALRARALSPVFEVNRANSEYNRCTHPIRRQG